MIDDQEGSMRSDLKVLVRMSDGKPLWDGRFPPLRCARRRLQNMPNGNGPSDQAIINGEIDLQLPRSCHPEARRRIEEVD